MHPIPLTLLLGAVFLSACATSKVAVRPVAVADVQRLQGPLTIASVQRVLGPSQSIPGPCFSYPSAHDKNAEVIFWYGKPKEQPTLSNGTALVYEVAYVALHDKDPAGPARFIWPQSASNLNVHATLEALYHDYP